MRYFIFLVSGIFFLILASCATTQPSGGGEPAEADTAEPSQPSWYNGLISSESDSSSFTGYAHAISMNRQEAETLAEESAMKNLRFEIDKFAEEVRRNLSEDSGDTSFESPSFIRNLRNTVGSMSLEGVVTETEFFEVNSVVNAYIQMNLSTDAVLDRLSERINNREFTAAMRRHRTN
jgi:hypothetical protein